MSHVAYEVAPPLAEENRRRGARMALAFALAYGGTLIAAAIYLTTFRVVLAWGLSLPAVGAATAICAYLLVISPSRLWPTLLVTFGAHAVAVAIAVRHYLERNPHDIQSEIIPGFLFWGAIAAATASFAGWDRRRYLRLRRRGDQEPQTRPSRVIPLTAADYVYLALVLLAFAALQKWGFREMTALFLPAGVVIAAIGTAVVRLGLARSRRGYSPSVVIVMGFSFVAAATLTVWFFDHRIAYLFLAVAGCPIVLWSGLILAIRGDGYFLARDFVGIVDKVPVAEPDPLA